MPRLRSQLERGRWPETRASAHEVVELTAAARRQAQEALATLEGFGIVAALDGDGRVRFKASKRPPGAIAMLMERLSDSIEAYLIERRDLDISSPAVFSAP